MFEGNLLTLPFKFLKASMYLLCLIILEELLRDTVVNSSNHQLNII